ncbi:caspase family protein [Bradyrhizobium sp. Arg816]|uniref:caspase family protein n=1 Tax=Bradyrhizobium sp. Arg816 TaxID=2998491 RepID=UPI00249E0940|nr:caspase family protein [Bradyrhizobium sp. Arg816]MDI3565014.1 caspase family protein [Bradyrhizobium sp. Arg816]
MDLHGFVNLRRILFLLPVLLLFFCQPASAGNRVALVIGNSAYKNAAPLSNPVNDAAIVEATLTNAGFDVVQTRRDLQAIEMRRTLRDFADQARDADVAVIYYAGHGMEIEGTNYLIPVDATLERDTDVYDEAFSLDRVMLAIEPARQLRLVILDACRNNPFSEKMKRTVGSRSISRGLARIEPATANTLVAFAAKAGSTASDGNSKNSPYAAALVKYIGTPGLDLRRVFGFVRDDVMKATGNRQEPYVYGTLGGDDVPLVPAKETAKEPTKEPAGEPAKAAAKEAAPSPTLRSEIRRDYELALQVGNKDALNFFIVQYPDGYYASLAKLQLAKIDAEEKRVAAAEKARQAEQEQARLVNEGAQQMQLAKAASDLKAAQEARTAAEAAKETAQHQAAQAEQRRVAAETAAAAKNAAPSATSQPQEAKANTDTKVAALPNPQAPAPPPSPAELAKSVQTELRRVGCLTGSASGEWDAASRRSLELFNQSAGTKFDTKTASADALDAIKLKSARVCPLICGSGLKRDGDHCVKITCAAGYSLNDSNECEKRKVRQAPSARVERREREAAPARPARPEASASNKPEGGGMPFMFFLP